VKESLMVDESVAARHGDPRVSTGNPSLDGMLEGGLVARRPYLIVGPSGTGKTTLALQFLVDGARRGEPVLLVTLEEPPNEARVNHRGLQPGLDHVHVFDAIPDIMRYERTPFKDIASVRSAVPFEQVPLRIRRSPELASVEVTITALEQMLRTEVIRKGYTRLVVDSLTALQYFCMKGFDPMAGAQSFLRFLSDLRVTTILTVEAPLEDVETPERMLARGEIRLFRWELEGATVRAIGVEKFRGSSHDVRLHPYRIGPQGIDINIEVTISRDTRQIIEPILPPRPAVPAEATPAAPFVSSVTPLVEEVRDLILLGADVAPARTEIEAAFEATVAGQLDEARAHLSRVSSLVMTLVDTLSQRTRPASLDDPVAAAAFQRVLARVDSVRTGVPPTSLPAQSVLQVQLGALLSLLPASTPAPALVPAAAAVPVEALVVSPPVTPAPMEPPAPPSEVSPPPATVPSAEPAIPVPALEVVEESRTPTPTPGPEPTLPPNEPQAAEVAEAPTAEPQMVEPAPVVLTKPLPAPPKPRASVALPRVAKPPSAPAVPRAASREEPPPLPKTTMPEWLTHPPHPTGSPSSTPVSGSASSPPTASPGATSPPRSPVSPAKRRRKPSSGVTSKRTAVGSRASTAHASAHAPSHAPPHAEPLPPALPTPPPSVPTPLREAPSAPAMSEAAPKPRKRAPHKRKAPPVVSAEVEPVPPGALGTSEEPPTSKDPPPSPTPPEG